MATTHARNETQSGTPSAYALGNTEAEHDRLIRQAAYLALLPSDSSVRRALDPVTEFWSLVPVWVMLPCWRPIWLDHPEKSWAWNAIGVRSPDPDPEPPRLV